MMLPSHQAARAAASATSVLYALCTLLFVLWPSALLQLTWQLMHMTNLEKYVADFQISWTSFIVGVLSVFVYTYAGVWLFCWFYNRSGGRK